MILHGCRKAFPLTERQHGQECRKEFLFFFDQVVLDRLHELVHQIAKLFAVGHGRKLARHFEQETVILEGFFHDLKPIRALLERRIKDLVLQLQVELEGVPEFLKDFTTFTKVCSPPGSLKKGLKVPMVCSQ